MDGKRPCACPEETAVELTTFIKNVRYEIV